MNFALHLHMKLNSFNSRKAFIISEIIGKPKSSARMLLPIENKIIGLSELSTKVTTS